MNNTEKWERSLCKACLGCYRLENIMFLGVEHCSNFSPYDYEQPEISFKQMRIEVKEC